MAIYVEINPREREATLRSAHSLCAGESSEIVLSGVPDADTATLSLRLYRDRSEAEFVAAARRPGDADPPQEGFADVQGRAALRRAVLDLRSESVASWASDVFERSESESDDPREAPRPPETAWMVVADVSRVWAACEVPFLLRPMSPESADVSPTLPSLVERAREAAESAERSAGTASEAARSASAAAGRAEAAVSGKADLVDGKVPASQLPSYVDDVLEVSELPQAGESGKLYVVTGTNAVYRWSGSSFVEVSPSRDWSGELAAKRDKSDLSVDPDFWVLVTPNGLRTELEKTGADVWEKSIASYGDVSLSFTRGRPWPRWTLAGILGEETLDKSGSSVDTKLALEGTLGVYRLYRAVELATNADLGEGLEGKADVSSLAAVATSGLYSDLRDTPTIPAAQVQSDWNQTNTDAKDFIKNKPTIPPAVTVDDTVTHTSANPVKSGGIWAAIWGALTALPTGFASLYDWCVDQLAGKLDKTDGLIPGGYLRFTGPANNQYGIQFLGGPSYADTFVNALGAYDPNASPYNFGNYRWFWPHVLSGSKIDEGKRLVLARSVPKKTSDFVNDGDGVSPFATVSQIPDISGKADVADLRYRIAEAACRTLPVECFPVTFTYDGVSYSIDALVKESEASATGDMYITDNGLGYDLVMVESPATGEKSMGVILVATFSAGGVFESSGIQDLQFGRVSPDADTSPTLTNPQVLAADRTVNLITVDDETSVDIEFPEVQAGYSRDFYVAVTCGSTAPTLNSPSDVTLVNAKGEEPDLTLTPDATTVLRFTEVKEADSTASPAIPAVFCVTGGANGGGSLDLSVLAEEFSEQATYEEGDIVQHNGDLYVCVLAIETPGTWDDADWSDASPVIPVLLGMIRGKADSSDLDSKADSTSLAPAWISGHAYFKGDHVSYNGLLYECLSTVAGSTDPSADTTHWDQTDLAAPDATLDILSDGRLRVVAADGTPMWTQGYALASESAVALSCEKINKYVFAATTATAFSDASTYAVGDRVVYGGKVYKCSTAVETAGAWTGAANWDEDPDTQAFALPNAPSGIVGDFVLDVDNTANEVPVMVAISGTLGTDYDLIVEKGRSSVDVLTIEGGALAELYFTMTAFGTAAKPAWRVVRLNIERQGVGS